MDERTRAHLLSIAVVSVFTFIGVYLCVIIPNKRNKRSFNSELVKGVIVDYIRTGRKRITFTGRIFFSSMPIYEYYYNGEKRKLRGNAKYWCYHSSGYCSANGTYSFVDIVDDVLN